MMFTKHGTKLEFYISKGIYRYVLDRIKKKIKALNPLDLKLRLITDIW